MRRGVRAAKRLVEIDEQVLGILDTGGQAQQVGRAGRTRPSIDARCSMRLSTPPSDVARFQSVTPAAVATALASPARDTNGQHVAEAAYHLPGGDLVPGMRLQAGIQD